MANTTLWPKLSRPVTSTANGLSNLGCSFCPHSVSTLLALKRRKRPFGYCRQTRLTIAEHGWRANKKLNRLSQFACGTMTPDRTLFSPSNFFFVSEVHDQHCEVERRQGDHCGTEPRLFTRHTLLHVSQPSMDLRTNKTPPACQCSCFWELSRTTSVSLNFLILLSRPKICTQEMKILFSSKQEHSAM